MYPQHWSLKRPYEDEHQSMCDIPLKKRPRTVPDEEKDPMYFEKRERNNQSAKRSRDARRIREEEIHERVKFFEHDIPRLQRENQTIQYQISQLHAIYNGITKPLQ